ncbi:hypothetical protein SESBI_40794 [Sesbania bispinosa]|nr:hypothetical protein SESBI_40794 [Sesbania bispinosa]
MTKRVLWQIGNALGKTVKIDVNTLQEWGNIHGGFYYRKSKCRHYWHKKDSCALTAEEDREQNSVGDLVGEAIVVGRETAAPSEGVSFGPWMIVQKNQRRNSRTTNGNVGDKGRKSNSEGIKGDIVGGLMQKIHDHKSLLMDTHPCVLSSRPRFFKFIASWLEDSSFKDLVTGAWSVDRPWLEAVNIFQENATTRNSDLFGNIFHRKRHVLARLKGVNKQLSMVPHGGGACFGSCSNKAYGVGVLKDIYHDPGHCNRWSGINLFPQVQRDSLDAILAIPTNEEIHATVGDMGPWKAPGPDNLHPMFFSPNGIQ